MAENIESGGISQREEEPKRVLQTGLAYCAPDFQTISAAKTSKKRTRKLKKTQKKPNNISGLTVNSLFLTDG